MQDCDFVGLSVDAVVHLSGLCRCQFAPTIAYTATRRKICLWIIQLVIDDLLVSVSTHLVLLMLDALAPRLTWKGPSKIIHCTIVSGARVASKSSCSYDVPFNKGDCNTLSTSLTSYSESRRMQKNQHNLLLTYKSGFLPLSTSEWSLFIS